mmetsp:Transcript_19954/g.39184  ORF Transcript_19954/g.39184 Transcript_19954/m.39184 type:complete len:116 (+) Transcript_19954:2824-3171(+)
MGKSFGVYGESFGVLAAGEQLVSARLQFDCHDDHVVRRIETEERRSCNKKAAVTSAAATTTTTTTKWLLLQEVWGLDARARTSSFGLFGKWTTRTSLSFQLKFLTIDASAEFDSS